MRLTFTKGTGRSDRLVVDGASGVAQAIDCPKQGIIPHDMVHYAVESVLRHRGFLSLVAEGQDLAFTTAGEDPEESVERLVETFQAEMWGGRVPVTELLETYAHACECRGHAVYPVTTDDVTAIRQLLDDLTARWTAVPVHGSLSLDFAAP